MKKLVVLLFLVLPFVLAAQKSKPIEIPQVVLNTFKQKITDSVVVTWSKEKDVFEAKFSKSNMKGEVEIKEDGQWINTSWELSLEFLPAKIKSHISTTYPGYKVKEAEIEYRQDGNFYIVEVKKKKETLDLTYTIAGEFVKSEKEAD
jgi:uncharacterized membrane protein YkoI